MVIRHWSTLIRVDFHEFRAVTAMFASRSLSVEKYPVYGLCAIGLFFGSRGA